MPKICDDFEKFAGVLTILGNLFLLKLLVKNYEFISNWPNISKIKVVKQHKIFAFIFSTQTSKIRTHGEKITAFLWNNLCKNLFPGMVSTPAIFSKSSQIFRVVCASRISI